jgi:hypothetical protein
MRQAGKSAHRRFISFSLRPLLSEQREQSKGANSASAAPEELPPRFR